MTPTESISRCRSWLGELELVPEAPASTTVKDRFGGPVAVGDLGGAKDGWLIMMLVWWMI